MPKITSNLEHTKAFIPADAGWYPAKVVRCAQDEKAKAGMISIGLDWQILDTSEKYPGKKINFDSFIAGGTNAKTGEPYSLNAELNYLGSLGVPYTCGLCNAECSDPPVRDRTDYRCPACKEVLTDVSFNTEDFVGKIGEIELSLENAKKYETNSEGNQVLVDSVDAEGLPIKQNRVKRVRKLADVA